MIKSLCAISSLTLSTLGYVRCQDLRSTMDPPDQIVIVIRAPPETQMTVTEPSEVITVSSSDTKVVSLNPRPAIESEPESVLYKIK